VPSDALDVVTFGCLVISSNVLHCALNARACGGIDLKVRIDANQQLQISHQEGRLISKIKLGVCPHSLAADEHDPQKDVKGV